MSIDNGVGEWCFEVSIDELDPGERAALVKMIDDLTDELQAKVEAGFPGVKFHWWA